MSKKWIISSVAVSFILVTIAISMYVILNQKPASTITGKVTEVVQRPNIAEDGQYTINLKDNSGKEYTVKATGYMNGGFIPDDVKCVETSDVRIGDTLEFNLPEFRTLDGNIKKDTYEICYKQGTGNYFFNVL